MLNIIKADIYRILRGKGFYITIGVLVAFSVLMVATSSVGYVGYMGNGTPSENVLAADGQLFTGMVAVYKMIESADNLLYFMLPFIIFVCAADFSSGTVKNVLTNGMSRTTYYFAKWILSCAFCICLTIVYFAVPLVAGTLMNGLGTEFNPEFIGSILRPVSAQLFLFLSVTSVGVFLTFVTKRTAAVNAAYIAFCILPMMIIAILMQADENLSFLFGYDITSNIRVIAAIDFIPASDIIRVFFVGGFYIFASITGGILLFQKGEIK